MKFPGKGNADKAEMPFFEHLEALRWHIIRSVIAIFIFMVIAFLSKEFVFDTLIFGPTKNDFFTYRFLCWVSHQLHLGDALCMENFQIKFINIEMSGQFLVHLKISMIVGFIAAFPYVLWELWRFVKPGLHQSEIRSTHGVVFFSTLLFLAGVMFGYFILTPFSINFFSSYQVTGIVENTFSLTNYIDFLSMFILSSGIVFELPMVVYFLSKLGLVTPEFMRTYRKHAVVVLLFIAAVVTPPDVGSQMLVFTPVYFLYEMSIFISARVEKNREKELQ